MSKKIGSVKRTRGSKISQRRGAGLYRLGLGLPAALALAPAAHALTLYDGSLHGNNLEINLNITTSYTGAWRLGKPNAAMVQGADPSSAIGVTGAANSNDGDANLRHGVIANLFEVLPVLDIKDGTFGMHFSGEYFVNTPYLGTNQNNQPLTVNPILNKNTDYASETRLANGHTGSLLDAYVYDSWNFGNDRSLTLKAGQQTLFWGQSLFSQDGISGGQAPIDEVQALSYGNPNPAVQSIFMPVGQIVATVQLNPTYALQGYYQYQWEPDNLEGVGSFFSNADVVGPGGSRIVAATLDGSVYYLGRTKDLSPPSQNGQFGLSVQATYGNYDAGLYMLRYDAKAPDVYEYVPIPVVQTPTPGGYQIGSYTAVYPRDIWLYGASLSTTIGATNVAGEVSVRTHDPLVGASGVAGTQSAANMGNASNDPLYPVGNVMVGIANFIYGTPSLSFDPGGITMEGEVEWDNVFRVTDNSDLLAPNRTSNAAAMTLSVTPAYFEVLPNLELQFPVTVMYNIAGNSQAQETMNHGTGNYSIGITATYKQTWNASFTYAGYFGRAGVDPTQPGTQVFADRSYAGITLSHTF